jgi:hypothetical protein
MENFLFTDGTNGVKEVQSADELQRLIDASPDKNAIRIWVFNTSEWLSYADFTRLYPALPKLRTTQARTNGVYVPETALVVGK